jgi:hypothetical protein
MYLSASLQAAILAIAKRRKEVRHDLHACGHLGMEVADATRGLMEKTTDVRPNQHLSSMM